MAQWLFLVGVLSIIFENVIRWLFEGGVYSRVTVNAVIIYL